MNTDWETEIKRRIARIGTNFLGKEFLTADERGWTQIRKRKSNGHEEAHKAQKEAHEFLERIFNHG